MPSRSALVLIRSNSVDRAGTLSTRNRCQGRDHAISSKFPNARQPAVIGAALCVGMFQYVEIVGVHGNSRRRLGWLCFHDCFDVAIALDLYDTSATRGRRVYRAVRSDVQVSEERALRLRPSHFRGKADFALLFLGPIVRRLLVSPT